MADVEQMNLSAGSEEDQRSHDVLFPLCRWIASSFANEREQVCVDQLRMRRKQTVG